MLIVSNVLATDDIAFDILCSNGGYDGNTGVYNNCRYPGMRFETCPDPVGSNNQTFCLIIDPDLISSPHEVSNTYVCPYQKNYLPVCVFDDITAQFGQLTTEPADPRCSNDNAVFCLCLDCNDGDPEVCPICVGNDQSDCPTNEPNCLSDPRVQAATPAPTSPTPHPTPKPTRPTGATCFAGFYSNTGTEPCEDCLPGYTCKDAGMTSQIPCPVNTFSVQRLWSDDCPLCAIGTSTKGQNAQSVCTDCSAGSYTTGLGSSCICASPGFFSIDPTNPTESICPIGTFQTNSCSASCDNCTTNTYCPTTGLSVAVPCDAGFTCPEPAMSAVGAICPPGFFCAQGEPPVMCPASRICRGGDTSAEGSGPCPNTYNCEPGKEPYEFFFKTGSGIFVIVLISWAVIMFIARTTWLVLLLMNSPTAIALRICIAFEFPIWYFIHIFTNDNWFNPVTRIWPESTEPVQGMRFEMREQRITLNLK